MVGTFAAAPLQAQTPVPSPLPIRLFQDQIDLAGRSNLVEGSGARAFGMGGAFLARADDATAASWNPAGLSYLRLPELSLVWAGSSVDSPTVGQAGGLTTDHKSGEEKVPDFLAGAYPFSFGSVTGAAQISFQRVISSTGDRTILNETQAADKLKTLSSQGGFDVIAFGTGLQLSRGLRAGVTINRWFNGYHQTVNRATPQRTVSDVDFGLSGWNVNLGVIWSPIESLNLGAVAKTPFDGHVTLSRTRVDHLADFGIQVDDTVTAQNSYTAPNSTAPEPILEFPGAFGFGASWRPLSTLTISADYTKTFWSGGRIHNYFTLAPNLPGTPDISPPKTGDVYDVLPFPTLYDSNQRDTVQVRAGVEYVLIFGRLKLPLRAGFFTDGQIVNGLNGEAPTFYAFTGGLGVIVGPVLLDIAYVDERGDYTDTNGGAVSTKLHRFLASAIYRHRGR